MLVSTEMPRETTSASDALEKPSNGLIVFVVDIHSPLRFRSLSVLGKAPAGSPGGFLTRLVACAINASTLPNPRQKPNTDFQGFTRFTSPRTKISDLTRSDGLTL